MDFNLTETQKTVQRSMQEFARKEIAPKVLQWDRDEYFPREIYQQLGKLGMLGGITPSTYGGPALDYISVVLQIEEIGYYAVDLASVVMLAAAMIPNVLLHWGTEDQKQKFLPPVCRGEHIWGVAATEPSGGTDISTMVTVVKASDSKYIVNGRKVWIGTAGEGDYFVVVGRLADTAKPSYISLVLERNSAGFSTTRYHNKLGHRIAAVGELIVEDCVVPRENLLGQEGDGLKVMLAGLELGRLLVAARCCGAIRACLDESVGYAQQRVVFDKPIGEYQLIQAKIADMAISLDAARLLTYRLAWLKDSGVQRARKESSIAKKFAAEAFMKAAAEAVQIMGAWGCTNDHKVAKLFRDAKIQQIVEGTSELHTVLIAESYLGLRKR